MNTKIILASLGLVIVGIIGYLVVYGGNYGNKNNIDTTTTEITDITEETGENVVEYRVVAYQWGWDPEEIVVPYGSRVRLIITSRDVIHGILIEEFGINEQITPGEETIVEFVANKRGVFEVRCSIYCGEGHSNMIGRIIVE